MPNSSDVGIELTMKTAVLLAALLASAKAFVSTTEGVKSTALGAYEDELGAQPPVSSEECNR